MMLNTRNESTEATGIESTEAARIVRYEWDSRPVMIARGAAFLLRVMNDESSETCENWFSRNIGQYAHTVILRGRESIGAVDNRRAVAAHFWAACEQRIYRQYGALE